MYKRPFSHLDTSGDELETEKISFQSDPEHASLVSFTQNNRYADSRATIHFVSSLWLAEFLLGESPKRRLVLALGAAGERISSVVYEKLVDYYGLDDELLAIRLGVVNSDHPVSTQEAPKNTTIGDYLGPGTIHCCPIVSSFIQERDLGGSRMLDRETPIKNLILRPNESLALVSAGNAEKWPLAQVGLVNLGNTCFMNSSLQALLHLPTLVSYFASNEFERDINEDNPIGCGGEVARAFAHLMKEVYTSHATSIDPSPFRYTIGRFHQGFATRVQQDSQEFTSFLLDSLHEDLNRVHNKPSTTKPELEESEPNTPANINKLALRSWKTHKLRHDSRIQELFMGMYKSTLVCPECHKISTTFDPFFDLTLPLPADRPKMREIVVVRADSGASILRTTVKLSLNGTIGDMKTQLANLLSINATDLVACEVFDGRFYQIMQDYDVLADSVADSDDVVVYETVSQKENETRTVCYLRSGTVGFGLPFFANVNPRELGNVEYVAKLQKMIEQRLQQQCESAPDVLGLRVYRGAYEDLVYNYLDNQLVLLPCCPKEETKGEERRTPGVEESQSLSVLSPSVSPLTESPTSSPNDEDTDELVLVIDLGDIEEIKLKQNAILENPVAVAESTSKESAKLTLDACLRRFSQPEVLGEQDLWYCPRCKEFRAAEKRLELWDTPEVLMIHLKRFSGLYNLSRKIDEFVDFPLEQLDLSPHISQMRDSTSACVYDLVAVDNHFGGLGGGHYTAYIKDPFNDHKWLDFNDSFVSTASNVVTSAAYLLFYVRRPTDGSTAQAERVVEKLRAAHTLN